MAAAPAACPCCAICKKTLGVMVLMVAVILPMVGGRAQGLSPFLERVMKNEEAVERAGGRVLLQSISREEGRARRGWRAQPPPTNSKKSRRPPFKPLTKTPPSPPAHVSSRRSPQLIPKSPPKSPSKSARPIHRPTRPPARPSRFGGCKHNPYMCVRYKPYSSFKHASCCNNVCVDVHANVNNCGSCGSRCRWGFSCCKGKCCDLKTDPRNCGEVGHCCRKGVKCQFGMCGY
ncbi:hypothetical protein L7F22_005734 [Adiantum nelumboides]|nr:hypothetical protein [Adiantum nelumboides]